MVNPFHTPDFSAVKEPANQSATKKGALVSNAISENAVPKHPTDFGGSWHTTKSGGRYIPFLNPKDSFASFLFTVRLNSPTTALCIGSKADYVAGGGVVAILAEGKEDEDLAAWMLRANNRKESFHDVVHEAAEHLYGVGNGFVEVVRGEVADEKFVKVYFTSIMDCRLMRPEDEWDEPTLVAKTRDFRRDGFISLREGRYLEIPIYDEDDEEGSWVKDGDVERTIIFLRNKMAGYEYYGMPSNITGLQYAVLEYKSASYNADNFNNNLNPGGIIGIQGSFTEDEVTEVAQNVTATHRGEGNQHKWAVLAHEQLEKLMIKPFDTKKDGSFIEFDKHVEKKIIMANEWDAVLAGVHKDSGLGNGGTGYIREVFNTKYETVIKPMQKYLLEHLIIPVMKIAGEWLENEWGGYKYALAKVVPTSMAGDIEVNKVMTKNEGRKAIGLEEKEGAEWEEVIDSGKSDSTESKKSGGQEDSEPGRRMPPRRNENTEEGDVQN